MNSASSTASTADSAANVVVEQQQQKQHVQHDYEMRPSDQGMDVQCHTTRPSDSDQGSDVQVIDFDPVTNLVLLQIHELSSVPTTFVDGTRSGGGENNKKKDLKNILDVIAVVDRSGSMGSYATLFGSSVLPELFGKFGIASDHPIDLITFETNTRHKKTTCERLSNRHDQIISGDMTVMAPAIAMVDQLLSLSTKPCALVVVVSDGEVNDADNVRKTFISGHGHQVFVLTIHVGRSADTSSLCHISQISDMTVPILEWRNSHSVLEIPETLIAAIRGDSLVCKKTCRITTTSSQQQQQQTGNSSIKQAQQPRLCRFPADPTGPLTEMVVFCPGFVLVQLSSSSSSSSTSSSSSSSEPTSVVLSLEYENDEKTKVSVPLQNVEHMNDKTKIDIPSCMVYFEALRQQIAIQAVANNPCHQDMLQWLIRVKNRLEKKLYADQTEKSVNKTINRVDALKRILNSDLKSLDLMIAEFKNVDLVGKLNNAEKAAFLTQLSATRRSDRAVARRSAAVGEPIEMVRNDIEYLASVGQPIRNRMGASERRDDAQLCQLTNMPQTMLYMMTPQSVFDDAIELVKDGTHKAVENVVDLLRVCGGIGLPFRARFHDKVRSYPNPWDFQIEHIYTESGVLLSETEVVNALLENKSLEQHLPNMKHNKQQRDDDEDDDDDEDEEKPAIVISGVIPIAFDFQQHYKAYTKSPFGIANQHASVAMRKCIANVHYTLAAMIAAGAIAMLRRKGMVLMAKSHDDADDSTGKSRSENVSWGQYDETVLRSLLCQLEWNTSDWPAANAFASGLPNQGDEASASLCDAPIRSEIGCSSTTLTTTTGVVEKYYCLSPNEQVECHVPYGNGVWAAFLCRSDNYRDFISESSSSSSSSSSISTTSSSTCSSETSNDDDKQQQQQQQQQQVLSKKLRSIYEYLTVQSVRNKFKYHNQLLQNQQLPHTEQKVWSLDLLVRLLSLDKGLAETQAIQHDTFEACEELFSLSCANIEINEDVLNTFVPSGSFDYVCHALFGSSSSSSSAGVHNNHQNMLNVAFEHMKQWKAMMVACSLLYYTEQSRHEHKIDVFTGIEIIKVLRSCAMYAYSQMFEEKLAIRMAAEAKQRLMIQAKRIVVETPSVEIFVEEMTKTFKDRGSVGLEQINEALLERVVQVQQQQQQQEEEEDMQLLKEKVFCFLTGHTLKLPHQACLFQGIPLRRNLKPFECLFKAEEWIELRKLCGGCFVVKHKYNRAGTDFNRHGYNNDLPSFYGLGYRCVQDFRDHPDQTSAWLAMLRMWMSIYRVKPSKCRGPAKFLAALVAKQLATEDEIEIYKYSIHQ